MLTGYTAMREWVHRISLLIGQKLETGLIPPTDGVGWRSASNSEKLQVIVLSDHNSPPPHVDQFFSLSRGNRHHGDPGPAPLLS